MTPKAIYYLGQEGSSTADTGIHLRQTDEARIKEFLRRWGWMSTGVIPLMLNDATSWGAVRFESPSCFAPVYVVSVGRKNQKVAVIEKELAVVGDEVFFVYNGQVLNDPPLFVYLRDGVGLVLRSTGLFAYHLSPYVVVIAPRECRLRSDVPWSDL